MPARTKAATTNGTGPGSGPGRGPTRIWPALQYIVENPGQSSRHIAQEIGVKDEGQMSRLLHRLRRLGLIETNTRRYQQSAWKPTPKAKQALRIVDRHPTLQPSAVATLIEDRAPATK